MIRRDMRMVQGSTHCYGVPCATEQGSHDRNHYSHWRQGEEKGEAMPAGFSRGI